MGIYDKIKALCDEKGISIYECERRAGIANGVIGSWRKSEPMFETISKVAKVLEVPLEHFLKKEE